MARGRIERNQRASDSALLEPRGTRGTEKKPGVPDIPTWSVTPWYILKPVKRSSIRAFRAPIRDTIGLKLRLAPAVPGREATYRADISRTASEPLFIC